MAEGIYRSPIYYAGSKRNKLDFLLEHMPPTINDYFEPFCGSCNVALALQDRVKERIILSDSNMYLINMLKTIRSKPESTRRNIIEIIKEVGKVDTIKTIVTNADITALYKYTNTVTPNKNQDPVEAAKLFIQLRVAYGYKLALNAKRKNTSSRNAHLMGIKGEYVVQQDFYEAFSHFAHFLNKDNVYLFCNTYRRVLPSHHSLTSVSYTHLTLPTICSV